jgi:hypothetical protein
MTLLNAAQVFDAPDLKEETVEIPEWPNPDGTPGQLRLREMDAATTALMTAAMSGRADDGVSIILIFTAVDTENNLIFTMEDLVRLRKKNFRVLDRLQRICLRLNGMGPEAKVTLKKD